MLCAGVKFSREDEMLFFVLAGCVVDILNHTEGKNIKDAARVLSHVKVILLKNPVFLERFEKAQMQLLLDLKQDGFYDSTHR